MIEATGTIAGPNDSVTLALGDEPNISATYDGALTSDMWLIAEYSGDGGNTWDERLHFNGDNWTIVDRLPHPFEPVRHTTILRLPTDTHMRLKPLVYNSGSVNVKLTAGEGYSASGANLLARATAEWGPEHLNNQDVWIEVTTNFGASVGFTYLGGSLTGTIVCETNPFSHKHETEWAPTMFWAGTQQVLSWDVDPNTPQTVIGALSLPGIQRMRLRVASYVSGTADAMGFVGMKQNDYAHLLTAGMPGAAQPLFAQVMAGVDANGITRPLRTDDQGRLVLAP